MSSELLLIEDMPSLRMVYEAILRKAGIDVVSAGTATEGIRAFLERTPDIVLLDLMLPDRDGLDLLRDMMNRNPATKVIVITANGSINKAVEAMRAGAVEYLVKPFSETRLVSVIENTGVLSIGGRGEPSVDETTDDFHGFIGSSAPIRDIYRKIASIGGSTATVFISGESGTGKEICANAIHATSKRATRPFVPLNCGAIPADLLESEVFGHLKGSFTGAIADKMGAAGAADGGTMFLDEICEMDLNLQTKLLRFLETSTIQPVGAVSAHRVDVRIICATNRDPHEEIRRGRFREDLFYRLHVVPIHLPALRDRGLDVVEIAQKMLVKYAREEGRRFQDLAPEVNTLFQNLNWPGNVRQLLNVLRNVVALYDGVSVTNAMLPLEILHLSEDASLSAKAPSRRDLPEIEELGTLIGRPLAEIERLVIEETIARNEGSITKASRVLEVSPSTLYRKRESWSGTN